MRIEAVNLMKRLNRTLLITVIIFMILPSAFAREEIEEYHLKEIVVVATKDPSPSQEVPSSISAFDRDTIENAGIDMAVDAAVYVPNIRLVEFTERLISQPYFRGVGSAPSNPAVTTYIDGVPQLDGRAANIEFIDVKQIEFVRGAQGMLYGRNTVGGVIHILSRSPNLESWEYSIKAEYGDYDLMRGQFRFSGPVVEKKMGLSLAAGYASRDGFNRNDLTGNDIDSRDAFFSKLQLKWLPTDRLSARFILFIERDRDGDWALHDMTTLRANPYLLQRDYEGYLDRNIFAPTLTLEYEGDRVDFVSITGFVKWDNEGETDLDLSPYPVMRKTHEMRDQQFTQEFQWKSAKGSQIEFNDNVKLKWQAGTLFFIQDYDEIAVNNINNPEIGFPVQVTSPIAKLEDTGIGAYAQGTFTAWDVWDCSLGLRFDYEKKDADLQTFYTPEIAPPAYLNRDRDFTEISPQFSLTRRIAPGKIVYGSIGRGYRAGGFNPVSPPGSEAYDEEITWNYETGAKTKWLEEHLKINIALFHIVWENLQLTLPFEQAYYIANAGDAESSGIELEIYARPARNWDIFGSFGYDRTRDTAGNKLIFTPEYTAGAGTQYSWELGTDARIFIRAEVNGYGRYYYNAANTQSQNPYWLTSFRAGYRSTSWFAELYVKNAFDEDYIPMGLEYPVTPSGFLGENGAPRMVGVRTGFYF